MTALFPNWQAPCNVKALSTTRSGGVSLPPYDSLNLGDHVGDDQNSVKTNRTLLVEKFGLPQFPIFLNQIHSNKVLDLSAQGTDYCADAVYSDQPNQVCLVMTADCLPVLFASKKGDEVAAAHAGWRGLCDGVLEQTVKQFKCNPTEIVVWLAPAIGKTAFQVGEEVVTQFIAKDPQAIQAFQADLNNVGKYYGDLYLLATQRLNKLGITQISGGEYCTYSDHERFFSYRREGKTGRMATLIWFE
ncbi:MAG: peptidoglycan editing factor PgeF [Lonepinella koalarum]|nr:peptidoglycan editing factor PgeF [Lonepinella koalarum]